MLNAHFNDKSWNYSSFHKKSDNKVLYFFTNNIFESTNTRAIYLYIKEKYNQDILPLLNYKDINAILVY